MFSCCVPGSRGCRLRGARGSDASRPWRQWVRSCTGRLRSLARRDPKKSSDEIGKRLAESQYACPPELCVCPVAQEDHPGPRERVAAGRSWEAEPGDGLGRPPSPPRPAHRVLVHGSWDQDPEPPEPEPEGEKAGGGRCVCMGPGRCWATQGGAPGGWCGARSRLRGRAADCRGQRSRCGSLAEASRGGSEVTCVSAKAPGEAVAGWGAGGSLPSSHPEALEPLQPPLCFLLKSPGQEQKPVRLQSLTRGHPGPRRLCRQGWRLERLLQGLESQQVTWDLCWDSGHVNRVSWFLLLLPTPFLPPPLFPCGFRPQIKGSKAFEGCFLYF
ncbi:uncharacterized protein LOC121025311 isoform X1 [Herpailurus yagouaroundi]|uniref:uncharacterized protein LOC121025311 isoform X1 n=1 Tax=Herpailurus yagouaroundi TaxID=1608482 RepID=UPI001AD7189B|nr:uncharacterized protein LOC121025311 isoform X1 [Puma yagouaroundi]